MGVGVVIVLMNPTHLLLLVLVWFAYCALQDEKIHVLYLHASSSRKCVELDDTPNIKTTIAESTSRYQKYTWNKYGTMKKNLRKEDHLEANTDTTDRKHQDHGQKNLININMYQKDFLLELAPIKDHKSMIEISIIS